MFTKQQTTNSFARYLHNPNNTKSRTIFIVVKIEDAVRLLFGLFTPDMSFRPCLFFSSLYRELN